MIGIASSSGIGLDAPRRLVAVDHRHLDVHQDQVRPLLGDRVATPPAPFSRLDHLVAGTGQQIAQDLPVVLRVLDHQDAFLLMRLPLLGSTLTGSVTVKSRALAERRTRRQIRPPCSSTICCEIDEPEAGAALGLACSNCRPAGTPRNSFCWSASAMPGPVSRTATLNVAVAGVTPDRRPRPVGELDGVADEVEQHLGEPPLVAAAGRQVRPARRP